MSTKTYTLILIGAGLVILIIGGLVGWSIKPEKTCPVITDTTYVKGDTIPVPYPVTVIKWKEKQPATETPQGYTAVFDSEFVSNKDTIGIKSLVSFNNSEKEFDMDMDIKHKDYVVTRVDSIKYKVIETQEVEIDNPLWIWTTIASGILLIIAIITGG